MNEERVRYTVDAEQRVGHLRLNRPKERNAIDVRMVEAIAEALALVQSDARVRCLLITGEGPSFCVGGDLKFLQPQLDVLTATFESMIGLWHETLGALGALPIPVVTAVHGGTAGGGLGLVWCADHVVAAENTKIATGFVELGLSGDGGSSYHLPRLVGLRRAQQMLLDNRVLDAATALEWGLVNEVVKTEDLLAVATGTANRFARRSLTAIGRTKELLAASLGNDYPTQLAGELRSMILCAGDGDVRAGLPAFTAKTAPVFPDGPPKRMGRG